MKPLEDDHLADRLFDGLAPPQPPPEVRERVMRVAPGHLAIEPPRDAWTRVWENRWLRLAWAATVLLLLAGNLVLPPRQRKPPLMAAGASVDQEVAEFLRPMRIMDTVIPNVGRSGGGRHELIGIDEGGNAS